MNTDNINTNINDMTDEEFFALHPQPPLTSSGYPLHFPSSEEVAEITGNYNNSNFEHIDGFISDAESDEDLALYERRYYQNTNIEDIPMDISDSESEEELELIIPTLQRPTYYDTIPRQRFQELEDGEIDESDITYQRERYNQEQEQDQDLSNLPDPISMEIYTDNAPEPTEINGNAVNKRKREYEE